MNPKIAKWLFLNIERLRKEPVQRILSELEKSQYYSKDQLLENQWTKLQTLVAHSYKNVPYYNKVMNDLGIEPGDIKSHDDYKRIPVMTKEKLRKHHNELIADDTTRQVSPAKTSGSTGISLKFIKDRTEVATQLAAMFRGHRWYGVDIGAKEARLWGIPVNFKARMSTTLRDIILNRFREREYNLEEGTLRHFYNMIRVRKPEYLMGYTSMVYQFAKFIKNEGLTGKIFNLKMVKCTSETIHDHEKRLIREVFGCPVVSEYGAAESGLISFECPEGKNHLMSDCVFTEFEKVNKMDGEDKLHEIIVTPLSNYAFPILRYKINDLVKREKGNCDCGRTLPLIGTVIGRTSDVVVTPSGKRFHSIVFYYIMKGLQDSGGGVKQFRVIQEARDRLIVFLVKDKKFTQKDMDYLNRKFLDTFGKEIHVKFNFTDIIEREPSGKLRDFISEIS